MNDIAKLARIQIAVIATFLMNKAVFRPYILENDLPETLNIFVWSYSNFCEAIVGTLTITSIGLVLNQRYKNRLNFKETYVYLIATILAAVYVITQELKIHNLGGQNVYDPFDVLFSVIGLIVAYMVLMIIKPKVLENRPVSQLL